jgi:NADPH:quinone reductase-like Zn-dependent oxidoreductase
MGAAALKPYGAFAERLLTQQKLVVSKPAALSYQQAATLPVVGVTAWRALTQKGNLLSVHERLSAKTQPHRSNPQLPRFGGNVRPWLNFSVQASTLSAGGT